MPDPTEIHAERGEAASGFLLQVTINGVPYDRTRPNVAPGSNLDVRISEESFARYGGFHVVRTPLTEYVPDFDAIAAQDGKQTDLGEIPSLLFSGAQSISQTMGDNTLYDLFYCHGEAADIVRLSTAKDEIPYRMTLDEAKLWLGFMTGQTPADLTGIKAEVVGDKVHMRNRHEFFQYGFRVGDLGATILRNSNIGMFFVDHTDFWRQVSAEEFGSHLQSARLNQ